MEERLFTFKEIIAIIRDNEEYVLQNKIYRLKKITCKRGIIEFESSDEPVRVSDEELYRRIR
jgi:hypothetical protein